MCEKPSMFTSESMNQAIESIKRKYALTQCPKCEKYSYPLENSPYCWDCTIKMLDNKEKIFKTI